MNVLEKLIFYWNYPFVRYALIVGVLIALCSSLLGVTLVLKRFSFIGDGLSHVAFGGMAIATVLGMSDHMPLTLAVTVACAVLLLHTGQNTQIKGDAAIAMVSVGALAMGYLLMNLFSTSANLSGNVCSSLFGSTSILTLTKSEVWLCIGLSIIVVAVFMLFYNKIFAVTFDETFAQAVGDVYKRQALEDADSGKTVATEDAASGFAPQAVNAAAAQSSRKPFKSRFMMPSPAVFRPDSTGQTPPCQPQQWSNQPAFRPG